VIGHLFAAACQAHREGRLDRAGQGYQEVLALEPDHAGAWHLWGVLCHQRGHHDQAAASIQRAIFLDGSVAAFHHHLGLALHALGRNDAACEVLERAVDLDPALAEAHNDLGNLLAGRGNQAAALACYRRAIALRPAFTEARVNLAAALSALGNPAEAVVACREALAIDDRLPALHFNLAMALTATGDLRDLLLELERVHFAFDGTELAPTAREALDNAGRGLVAHPEVVLYVDGHTDERGTEEYNMGLGDRRARTVVSYLTSYGVPAANLRITSFGEAAPRATGGTELDLARNRRVAFRLLRGDVQLVLGEGTPLDDQGQPIR